MFMIPAYLLWTKMLAKTHSFILREALKLTSNKFKGYEDDIENGCIKEDNPSITFNYDYFQLFGGDHFYHPIKKQGYFSFSGDAKQKGLFYFNKAIKLYKEDRKKAFNFLGKSLHMLADIAVPSHTKLEFHLVDIFEHYVNNNIPHFKFKFKSKIIPKISASHCFERLAKKSFRVKYRKRFFFDFLHLLGMKMDKHRHRHLHKISNKLLSSTILYSAVLLSIFHRKIKQKEIKNKAKEKFNKIKTKAKKILR